MDRNATARPEIRNWSETRWLGTWNPDAGVGFYLHAGRFRHDVTGEITVGAVTRGPLFFTECIARYTTADGQVGYGHLERSARRERFDRQTLAIRDPRSLGAATGSGR